MSIKNWKIAIVLGAALVASACGPGENTLLGECKRHYAKATASNSSYRVSDAGIAICTKAALSGIVEAQSLLARIYFDVLLARKLSRETTDRKAAKWARIAAENGDLYARYILALMYWDGLGGVQKSLTHAYKWIALARDCTIKERNNCESWKSFMNTFIGILRRAMNPQEFAKAKQLLKAYRSKMGQSAFSG